MNTAAPTTAHKKLVGILLTIVFALTCLPAALAVDLNVDAGFYFKQSRGGTCTLASAAMMLRRRAYFDGRTDWVDVTENSVRSTAWSNGLAHSFTYREMQVAYATLPSNHQEKTQLLIQLLAQHPEGIVLYDRTQPHAVLLTDYTNGVCCSMRSSSLRPLLRFLRESSLMRAMSSFVIISCYPSFASYESLIFIIMKTNGNASFFERGVEEPAVH